MARKSLEKLEQEHSQDQPAPEQPEQETAAGGFTSSDDPATEDEAPHFFDDMVKLLFQQAQWTPTNPDRQEIVFTATGKQFRLPEQLEEYRKDNPLGAALCEQEHKQEREIERANNVIRNLPLLQFAMGFLKDPGEDWAEWPDINKFYPWFSREHSERLFFKAHKQTGGDIEQIRDPNKRTPEQWQFLAKEIVDESKHRIWLSLGSNYMQALNALEPASGRYQPCKPDPESCTLKELAVLYFFAKHTDIKPDEHQSLTEAAITELTATFTDIDSYYMERTSGGKDDEPDKLFYKFIKSDARPGPSKRAKAEASGALMSIGNRLLVPSDPEYQNAFITSVSSQIGLFKRDGGKKKQLALNLDTCFISSLANLILLDSGIGNETALGTSVHFPSLARELGIDINHRYADKENAGADADTSVVVQESQKTSISRAEARKNFIGELLMEMDNIWGTLPHDATEYKLISVLAYNPETEMLHFVSPYLQQYIKRNLAKEKLQIQNGEHFHSWHCDLLHSTAANERIPAAVEMATRILVGVQQRGTIPDAELKQNKKSQGNDKSAATPEQGQNGQDDSKSTVTWKISCARLIADCPKIRERLKQQKNTSARTKILNRTFKAMHRILKEKTDIYKYYSKLTITDAIPVSSQLSYMTITVTHHGKNPEYERPALPIRSTAGTAEPDPE